MTTTVIPWPVFFQVLRKQRSTLRQAWLRYWMFSDDGAALIPKLKDRKPESLSLEEKQKVWALFAATRGKQARTLH